MNKKLAERVDQLCDEFELGFDDFITELSYMVAADKDKQTHPVVISLLQSAEESLRRAAFDIYASYK